MSMKSHYTAQSFPPASMKSVISYTLMALGATAAPQPRQIASTCELDPTFTEGLSTPNYYVANWASEASTAGQQCSVVDSYDATSISWHSTFSWDSSRLIRGNPNAGYSRFKKGDISQHKSIPVSWEWNYEGDDVEAAVLFNLLGSGEGCPSMPSWTISIWLGTYGGLKPNDGQGNAGTLVNSTTISGVDFDVYRIPSSSQIWYAFQAKRNQTRFDGDLVPFVMWPHKNTNTARQFRCVWNVQGGTEIWGGKEAKFTSKKLKVSQNLSNGPVPHA